MRQWIARLLPPVALATLLLCVAWSAGPARAATSSLSEWQQLPDMGAPATAALMPGKEQELGAEAVRSLRQHGLVLDDPEVRYYLQSIGNRLAAHAPSVPFQLHYLAIRNPTLNSFAMPGGYIGIQTGLVVRTRNEDELAAVMAHETGHEVQRHIARQIAQNKRLGAFTIASLLAAAAAGALTGNPGVGLAAMGLGTTTAMQKHINYTRADEEEADRVGIRMLAAAGYDPESMATFFGYLAQSERMNGGVSIPAILLDHPVTSERIADAEARASQYPARTPTDNLEYRLMRARCRVLASPNLNVTATHFRGAGLSDPANRYGLALTWAKQGKLDKARGALEKLLQKRPKNVHLRLEMATIMQMQGHVKKSLKWYKRLQQDDPGYPPQVIAHADALEQDGQFQAAWGVLKRAHLEPTPKVHHLLAVAANRTGKQVEARYELAGYYFMQGNYEPAIKQLQLGLKVSSISTKQRTKLKGKLEQVQKAAKLRS